MVRAKGQFYILELVAETVIVCSDYPLETDGHLLPQSLLITLITKVMLSLPCKDAALKMALVDFLKIAAISPYQ